MPHLVAQVSQQVLAHELSRVRSLPMDSLASYSLLLGANGLLNSLAANDFDGARGVLEHLSERHPRQAAPNAMLSAWHIFKVLQGWTDDPAAEAECARIQAQQAMDKNPTLPAALVADGVSKVFTQRDFEGAALSYREALRQDPHCAPAWARLSECQSEAGQHPQALESVTRAIDLSPLDPQRFVYECYAARTSYLMKCYAQAADLARASVRRHALHAPSHRLLIAALWMQDKQQQARDAAINYVRLLPGAMSDMESARTDSFFATPQGISAPSYTRPPEFRGHAVPEVLLSGHHERIARWRAEEGRRLTVERSKGTNVADAGD